MNLYTEIKKKANSIRNKVYGREVRESLASGIEAMAQSVIEIARRQTSVESKRIDFDSKWNDTMDELTKKDVISAPEIIEARGAESKLANRLNNTDKSVSSIVNGLQPKPLQNVKTKLISIIDDVTPKKISGGYLWGTKRYDIYRSEDGGETWVAWGRLPETMNNIMHTDDDEVVITAGNGLYKSNDWESGNPTFTKKVSPNGNSQFQQWSLCGNGTKFLTTEYAAGSNFADSRYVRMSFDAGDTWEIVYDSVEEHGAELANQSHLHGAAYDKWADRWYISEGHKAIAGIYVSEDDGFSWKRAEGMAIMDPAPTVIVPTPEGLVCGSDHPEGGLYGVERKENVMDEELTKTVAWNPAIAGTNGFGVSGVYDEYSGVTYISYRTEKSEAAPVIMAGTTTAGEIVYTWDKDFQAYDDISHPVITQEGELTATAYIRSDGETFSIKADIVPSGTSHVSLYDKGGVLGGTTEQPTSLALGVNSKAEGLRSVASGVNAMTKGTQDSVAIGYGAYVESTSSTAIGSSSKISSSNSVAIGNSSSVTGANSVALGSKSEASSGGIAIGHNVTANTASIVIGDQSEIIVGSSTVNVGYKSKSRNNGVAIGINTEHHGNDAVTVGALSSAGGESTAIGKSASARQLNAVAIGANTTTKNNGQVALGERHIMLEGLTTDAPASPEGGGMLYFKDNALYVRFSSGAPIKIAEQR